MTWPGRADESSEVDVAMRVFESGKADWTAMSTLDEERQEALESVLTAMAAGTGDAAHAEACRYLMGHLTASSRYSSAAVAWL
jgi:hypothetical protein